MSDEKIWKALITQWCRVKGLDPKTVCASDPATGRTFIKNGEIVQNGQEE